jgi:hypothetical protein
MRAVLLVLVVLSGCALYEGSAPPADAAPDAGTPSCASLDCTSLACDGTDPILCVCQPRDAGGYVTCEWTE